MSFVGATAEPFTLSSPKFRSRAWPTLQPASTRVAEVISVPVEVPSRPVEAVQERDWLSTAINRINELAQLPEGWDGSSALPLSMTCVSAMTSFVSSPLIQDLQEKPQIVPTTDGGLVLEWHTMEFDFSLETSPIEPPTFYYHEGNTGYEDEGFVTGDSESLVRAFSRLSQRP